MCIYNLGCIVGLESPRLLCCNELRVIDKTIPVLVVHIKYRVNHVNQLLVCKDLGGSLWRGICSHVFAFFH